MGGSDAIKTPWEFRLRALFIALAFFLGFFVGYPLQKALFHGDVEPTFVVLGKPFGPAGIEAAAWIAAALAIAAWLIRFWGSSFHAAGVVMSSHVVADTFTAAGPYRYVRNPLYFGNLLLALGVGSLGPPITTVLVLGLNLWFVWRLIAIEEAFLHRSAGTIYDRYCAAVPRLLPRLTPAALPEEKRQPDLFYGFITELFSLGFACAMVYVAVSVPSGQARYAFGIFWSIAGLAILLQAVFSRVARRVSVDRT